MQIEKKKSPSLLKAVALGVAGLAVAAGVAFSGLIGGGPSGSISAADAAARTAAFETLDGLPLDRVQPGEIDAAIAALDLPAADAGALRAEVEAGRVDLGWVSLWDDLAEDGDVVRLESDGIRINVRLSHAPTKIAMPVPAGGLAYIYADFDGGGGVTVGVSSSAGAVYTPVMQVGQVTAAPVG